MLKLINSIRDKITTALAYVRAAESDNDELEAGRKTSDNALSDALVEIGEYLDSHESN